MGWNLNDSSTSLLPNISFRSRAKLLHSTKMWRSVRIHWQCSHWGEGSFFRMYEWANVYDRRGHDTRQLHPSCTACRRTANLPGLAWQNEACLQPHQSNHLVQMYVHTNVHQQIICPWPFQSCTLSFSYRVQLFTTLLDICRKLLINVIWLIYQSVSFALSMERSL